jgi:hypothetical protein
LEDDAQVQYEVATFMEEALEIDRVMGMDHWLEEGPQQGNVKSKDCMEC